MRGFKENYLAKRRINFLIYFSSLLMMVLMLRLFYLQVVRHDYYVAIAKDQYTKEYSLPAKRGRIYLKDRYSSTGKSIASMNNTLNMVYAVPKDIKEPEKVASEVSLIIDRNKDEILKSFSNSPYYVVLKRKLSDEETEAIKDLNLTGLVLVPETWRFWPEKSLLSQVLGFVNMDGKGQYGLEQEFNKELCGVPGQLRVETDAIGTIIATGDNIKVQPKDGDDLVLTIDKNIQSFVENALDKAVKKHRADEGTVIVMDPYSGDIIAMATQYGSKSNIDLNNYNKISMDDLRLFDNSAIRPYEPGSIFKVLTMAAGLDSGKIKADETFLDTGKIVIDGHPIMNSDKKSHGLVDMSYVLQESLNLGTTHIQQKLGKSLFYEYLTSKFGFGTKTGIELGMEDSGQVSSPSQVSNHTYASISFGQAITATPVQLAAAVSAIANGGNLVRPTIIDSFIREGKFQEKNEKEVIKRAISQQASKEVTMMMVNVVEKGHGKRAKVNGYKIAGKTGTAQVPIPGGYDPNKTIGSFVGFGPATNPKFVVLTRVVNPKDVIWAESTAAPLFSDIMSYILNYYQIPPDDL
jgi:stage V sporulation protein D (sporulation-specific penicillin-binding protein)